MKIRQQAPTLDGIREDHRERYLFAARTLQQYGVNYVTDIGCGVGYGAYLLAKENNVTVTALDRDEAAIQYADVHYSHPRVSYIVKDIGNLDIRIGANVVAGITAFEIIEHSVGAPKLLSRLAETHCVLVGSVPNENVVPFKKGGWNPEHYRHYTPYEITKELHNAGWNVTKLGSQRGKRGESACIDFSSDRGRTLVFVAESKVNGNSI